MGLGIARVQGGGTPLSILGSTLKVWHDNQDLTTMFADYVGTPATVGSAVALQLDKSARGVLGSDIKSTGTPAITGVATAATYDTVTGAGTANRVDGSNSSWIDFTGDTVGRPYFVDIENTGSANLSVRNNLTTIYQVTAGQRKTVFVPALVTGLRIYPDTAATSIAFTVHSVKEVLGTPRYQSTAAQRPILGRHPKGGRRNQLVRAREFDNASWGKTDATITANAANGVGGDATMDLCTEGTVGNSGLRQAATIAANSTNTFAADFKRGNTDWVRILVYESTAGTNQIIGWFNLATGAVGGTSNGGTGSGATVAIRNLGNGIYRCILTGAVNNSATAITIQINSASANSANTRVNNATYYADRAQLESGSVETAFQDVTTQYDCTETGVPDCYYLQADGSDDGMVTPALDLSATDEIGVFTAVRKLSDAAAAMVAEFSASTGGNNGSFGVQAPAGASASLRFVSRGTAEISATYTNAAVAAPYTAVLTGLGDISGDSVILRANGSQVASAANDQGTGNYGNYQLYFFRRGGASLPFNGLEYGYALGDALPSAAQITSMENYYNGIVGAY